MGSAWSRYNQKTFKKIRKINEASSKRLELANFLQSTISQGKAVFCCAVILLFFSLSSEFLDTKKKIGNIREAVKLPKTEDLNEWLAVNIIDFYNQISIIYGE